MNPLQELNRAGQSVWLDFLRRTLVTSGGLKKLIDEDSLSGVTSNPSIFAKAIGGSTDYDQAVADIAEGEGRDPLEVFYDLALVDIQMAADVLKPVYDATEGADGFVSFELEPRLAKDADGSIAAAKSLWSRINRPNVMIKVPGTPEGIVALKDLIAAGINVNVTLLFAVEAYEEVAASYIAGLEERVAAQQPVDRIASVASFFVSRVDSAIDGRLPEDSPLRGQAAVANAKMAYQSFQSIFSGDRWRYLTDAGARVQRPLWASTSTKDPHYSDTLYVAELVGPDTVNTMPSSTMDAFRDHGEVRPNAVTEGVDGARTLLESLAKEGIDMGEVTATLLEEGLASFEADLQKLLQTIDSKLEFIRDQRARSSASLGDLEPAVAARVERMEADDIVSRIWRHDHTVWKPDPTEITNRLGWLTVMDRMRHRRRELQVFAKQAASDGYTHAVLLGMGGSSLAPEVFRLTFGVADGMLDLIVLDTTHPATIERIEGSLDLSKTTFLVSSKSGTTTETLSHFAHFWSKTGNGDQFIAITDPGSSLETLGREHNFRAVFLNPEEIGGRYSALSFFGLVPAALIGADVAEVLDRADEMAAACHEIVHVEENPGGWLGAVMGEASLAGRDKCTLVAPDEIASFGNWVEQLIAESTGKEGKGIVPITGEDLGGPDVYGEDRLFVAIGDHDGLDALEQAGHAVVRLAYDEPTQIGAEFFRWELATAVAGYVLGINAFDQPNVAEAKAATKEILEGGAGEDPGFDDLTALLAEIKPGDYVSIHAYLDRTPQTEAALQRARLAIRDRYRVATTVGFGPRFLHSTGQLHKGGPNTGVFIQVVDEKREADLPIPGASYTFGTLIDAQALGDLRSLRNHDRRVARVTLEQLTRTG